MPQTSRVLLIIDDSPEDRELYRRYLLRDRDHSYTVLEAGLGRHGLELWQQHHPDAVLLDYRLPDLDGLEFLAKLQPPPQQPYLPVIMITGQGNEAIAVQAMKAGAQDYLVKEQITPEELHLAVNGAIETVHLRTQLHQRIERERVVSQITQKIHQTLDLEEILQTTVTEVRQFLQADRVFVYRFQPDFSGIVVLESVGDNCVPVIDAQVEDQYFVETRGEDYRQGRIQAVADIYTAGLTECHVNLLAQFHIRANLVVPILHADALWGLLVANQCSAPRQWQPLEIDLLKELATQLGIALQQAELYQQSQTELTERRRVEAELRESEARLKLAYKATRSGLWDWNIIHNSIYVSEEYCALFGLDQTRQELSYEQWLSCLHPDDRPAASAAISHAIQHQQDYYEADYRILSPVGAADHSSGVRWIASRGQIFYDVSGHAVRMLGNVQDITERKRVEAERQQAELERDRLLEQEQAARAEAERANRVKDEFLAILSHELRAPLTPIMGWAQLLQTGRCDATKTANGLAMIERYARIQAQLINDLLDVAKILHGKLSVNAGPVNLVLMIKSAIDTVRIAAADKSILLHAVLDPVGQVWGDAARLQQIVWNLLSNAIKFTPEGGRVEVRLERVQDGGDEGVLSSSSSPPPTFYAQITVTDTGKGISPDFLPHIFESFRQEDASTTRKYGGLGLGLAIVRHLVEAHGGTISADSKGEGQGAAFTVRLPLLDPELQQNQPEDSPIQELDLTGVRVLVVDDDLDVRELLAALLNQFGAEVLTIASASEALASLESFRPDVLISDIGMPVMDGYALLQQVRSLPPNRGGETPAIALTAYARAEDQQRALACGFQRHIPKPLDLKKLIQTVSELARRPQHSP
ncbi:MAG: response regulator [Leptolyngbya sp. IPPAS B-1204]|nr:response regulator [Elainella sp. C42_A2020_010]RNJ70705.1 MAG: response regulator [Leptolyngbya sp. IPPAS B-1204]